MLVLEDVSLTYGRGAQAVQALAHVSLTLKRGQVLALIGASGCGKSTLLHVCAGLMYPTEGRMRINGVPLDPRTLRIGFLPQNYGLLAWKTVRENILLGRQIKGEPTLDRTDAFMELVEDLGLSELLERYPHELSGGQQQRVGLARVFFLAPDLLLMDEPFSALDALTRESMQEVFLILRKKHAVTTVLVTHYVEEALVLAERIAVMGRRPGRITALIDNPLAGDPIHRSEEQFFAMGQMLRAQIGEAGAR